MTLNISQENLENQTVLEVGSGRGETTRYLADLLSRYDRARLIVTDITDQHFEAIRQEMTGKNVQKDRFNESNCFCYKRPPKWKWL